jgi:fucose permease
MTSAAVSPTATADRRALFAVACLGMLTFGIVLTTLGSLLPSLVERFGIGKGDAGALFLLMSFAILVGSLVFGPIADRRGYKSMLLIAVALIALGLEGIAFAPSVGWLRVAIALIGFGGGIVNGGTNALVADVSAGERSAGLSVLGVFFGIGAVGVPFALSLLLGRFSYGALIAGVGVLVLVPLAVTAVTPFPAPKQAQGFPLADAGKLLRDPALLLLGLILFFESGMEITLGGWTSTYFHEELGIGGQRALVFLSLYWFGLMLARLALGALLRRVAPARVLLACLGVGFIGAVLLVATHDVGAAAAGVFLLGCGCAASFPVVLGFVGDRYARLSGTAFSVVIVMALSGGMLLPYATGELGALHGLRASFLIVPAAFVLMAVLLALATRRLGHAAGAA